VVSFFSKPSVSSGIELGGELILLLAWSAEHGAITSFSLLDYEWQVTITLSLSQGPGSSPLDSIIVGLDALDERGLIKT
jgi:hypothetical protein